MQWFCGTIKKKNHAQVPMPYHGKNIGDESNPLWICGEWKSGEVRTFVHQDKTLYVIGHCFANDQEIEVLFQKSENESHYGKLMKFNGNYHLIIQEREKLFIYGDVVGLRPIYYIEMENYIVFSSSSLPLQQLIQAKLNSAWIAMRLICPGAIPGVVRNQGPYKGIQLLEPGCFLTLSKDQLNQTRYWSAPEAIGSCQENAPLFRERLLSSLRERLAWTSRISSNLSGGMDSTSLAVLTAKLLEEQNQKLYAFTQVTKVETEDAFYAKEVVKESSNIHHVLMDQEADPYDNITEFLPLTDEPVPIGNIEQIKLFIQRVHALGSEIHLDGGGGDNVLCAPYAYLADLIKQGKYKTFLSHAYAWARLSAVSPLTTIRRIYTFSRLSYPGWLQQQIKILENGTTANSTAGWFEPPSTAAWFSKQSHEMVTELLRQSASQVSESLPKMPGTFATVAGMQCMGRYLRNIQQLIHHYGIHYSYPYFDQAIVDICLATRAEERMTPYAFKPLLVQALQQDLPDVLLKRRSKGSYSGDYYKGMRKNLSAIQQFFQSSRLHEMGLIDAKMMIQEIETPTNDLGSSLQKIIQVMSVEAWLQNIEANQPTFWSEEAVPLSIST
ncbi:albusnodin/ikarugamycin family macrolactam cyclase [Paenactinomyces guangxiensis]|uniref:asparagine synthase (glutamine-hydrolyzing) n=1 Tax=Paenactinomyces guangxiensis TaxID=1490290 RepID=A0A7W2A8H1_9BACL|nr:albusnodin/ikarugamycin family macrolactam cyclase [Paenactinomyces guangxiensis]MBA4493818.1 albusnodin/ikarugamycin family macrolactam cyclase [Paenactinomyces guangxiensis]MBH8591284.1 albusnodin/ikarugamycin family macrolactam cyclase [Paenactinomyces guangxiensis]